MSNSMPAVQAVSAASAQTDLQKARGLTVWCFELQAAAHVAAGKPGAKFGTSGEASPSYLRSTAISQIRAGQPTPKKEEQGFSNFVPN